MTQFSEGTTEIRNQQLASILLCAFRYSLGRMTYITSECAGWLIQHWSIIPSNWQRQIQNDIRQAIEAGCAGHSCDVASWNKIAGLPITNPNQELNA